LSVHCNFMLVRNVHTCTRTFAFANSHDRRYTAIGESGAVSIDVVLTEEEDASFINAMSTEGYACIDTALASIQSENATATVEADLNAIRELIKSKPGGFETLDTTVRNHLHEWFEDRGAIKSARRLDRAGRMKSRSNSARSLSLWSGASDEPNGYLEVVPFNRANTPNASGQGDDGRGSAVQVERGGSSEVVSTRTNNTAARLTASPRHEYTQIDGGSGSGSGDDDNFGFVEPTDENIAAGPGSEASFLETKGYAVASTARSTSAARTQQEYAHTAEDEGNWGFDMEGYPAEDSTGCDDGVTL
jgi:hypothetical protein